MFHLTGLSNELDSSKKEKIISSVPTTVILFVTWAKFRYYWMMLSWYNLCRRNERRVPQLVKNKFVFFLLGYEYIDVSTFLFQSQDDALKLTASDRYIKYVATGNEAYQINIDEHTTFFQ